MPVDMDEFRIVVDRVNTGMTEMARQIKIAVDSFGKTADKMRRAPESEVC